MKKKPSKEKKCYNKKQVKEMNGTLKKGDIIKGKVSGIESYGIFVHCENGYSGMIHISEVSDRFVKDINDFAKINETIPCKILDVNHKTKKIKLSIKNLDYHLRREEKGKENFVTLKLMLPKWIEEKIEELNKKS